MELLRAGDASPEDAESVLGMVRRIIDQRAAVGVSRRAPGFYLRFEMLTSERVDECVEVTFNPEFVEIDDHDTDVIVGFGTTAEVLPWLSELLRDLAVELCPARLEQSASDSLFSVGSRDRIVVDLEHPWQEWEVSDRGPTER